VNDVNKDVYLKLPNGELISIKKYGIIDIRVETGDSNFTYFQNVMVFLVQDNKWTELLIGRPTLRKYHLLPEQNFPVQA